jgi:hypothetical protein
LCGEVPAVELKVRDGGLTAIVDVPLTTRVT